MENLDGSVSSREAKASPLRLLLNVMLGTWGKSAGVYWLSAVAAVTTVQASAAALDFCFDRDTLAFQNATVLKYKDGVPFLRAKSTSDDLAHRKDTTFLYITTVS